MLFGFWAYESSSAGCKFEKLSSFIGYLPLFSSSTTLVFCCCWLELLLLIGLVGLKLANNASVCSSSGSLSGWTSLSSSGYPKQGSCSGCSSSLIWLWFGSIWSKEESFLSALAPFLPFCFYKNFDWLKNELELEKLPSNEFLSIIRWKQGNFIMRSTF